MEIILPKPGQEYETNMKEHFHFVGKMISDKEIDSFLPFFQCDEIGHDELMLDQVCLDNQCPRKGLTCTRCVHLRHSNHANKVVSLRMFIGDLLASQTAKKQVLQAEEDKAKRLRDLVIGMAREFIDGLIDLFSVFVASIHKYHTIFENEFEDCMIRSDVIVHKLMHKQHVRRDQFSQYIQKTVGALGESGVQSISTGGHDVVLRDYEKAFKVSTEFYTDMTDVAKTVKLFLEQESIKLHDSVDLKKISSKVPEFDVATLAVQHKFKKDYRSKLADLFSDQNIPGASSLAKGNNTNLYDYYSSQSSAANMKKEFEIGDQFKILFGKGKQSFLDQLEMLRPTLLETQIRKKTRQIGEIAQNGMDYEARGSSSLSRIGHTDAVDLYLQEKQKLSNNLNQSFSNLKKNNNNSNNNMNIIQNGNNSNNNSLFVSHLYGQSLPLQQQLRSMQNQQQFKVLYPRLSDMVDGGDFYACSVDSSRRKCILGRLFKSVANSQIYKLSNIKSSLKEISCICVICEDVIAVGGRFCQYIEFYRVQDRQVLAKVDTGAVQGIKSLLLIRKEQDEVSEWQPIIIAGTYSDESTLLSYKIDILRRFVDAQEPLTISVKSNRTFEKHTNEAVTCLAQLYLNEFFIAGYSSGSLAIFSTESSIPLNILPKLYDAPVTNLITIEEGKFFVSSSTQKIRFHTIKQINHQRLEQEVTAFYIGTSYINCLLMTNGFNQEESYLKFQHLLCGDLKFEEKENSKEGCVRILRTAQNNIRLTEEAILPVQIGQGDNSIIDMILIEPRKKSRVIWLLTFGREHRVKLWELKGGYTDTLKLWEKGVNDYLLYKGSQVVKAKLLCESLELTSLKWPDVQSKVQLLSAYENNNSGKILIRFAIVNHLSKSDIDIYELEMMVSYQ